MPDYPSEIRKAAAEAVFALNIHGSGLKGLDTRQEADAIARAVLDAVAVQLGEHCAGKISEHAERQRPRVLGDHVPSAWHRHFGIAARVAARAFLTEDDRKRLAAQALARGDFAACRVPEDGDER